MAIRLKGGFTAAFNTTSGKSDIIANTLIDRVLAGDYLGSREFGARGSEGRDNQIIGILYLMPADENTYTIDENIEAFVLKIDHNQRIVDYAEFENLESARLYMTANSLPAQSN